MHPYIKSACKTTKRNKLVCSPCLYKGRGKYDGEREHRLKKYASTHGSGEMYL